MDLQEFEEEFGTEKQCLDYLFHLRWKQGYRCPRCRYNEMWEINDHKYKCKNCGYQTTVISGTLFQDTHVPLNLWFRAIWYVTEQPDKVTAVKLQKELGLGSNRTALMMLNKMKRAMLRPDMGQLQGTVEVNREQIQGCKPRRYLAVAVEISNKKIGRIKAKIIDNTDPESMNDFIKDCVEEGSTIISNYWDGRDKMMNQRYTYEAKLETYEFPYADKVFRMFRDKLWQLSNATDYLDEFCASFNGLKKKITFHELLDNAVHSQPIPHACSNILKNIKKKAPTDELIRGAK